ncbi:uncharacterized protein LOC143908736 [Temnothorax americanus]|uniref:uncharacterized protein LOC143908736 n=1 Tax=Temnothorax americanus TaxID=1964332 RepID=UPI004068D061
MSRGNVTKRELCVKRMREIHELSMLAADNVNQRPNFLVRYPIVTKLVEDFEAAHLKIIQNASDEEFETEDSIRRDFDEMSFAVIGRYKRFVGADRVAAPAPQAPAQTSSVKLPKISLPQFLGDLTLWPSFIALYNISIHENRNVPTIEKYQYLISCLKGEALNVVKNIPLSADNYAIAYDALILRYQNKRDLADYHVDLMLKAQPLKSESAVPLRTLLSTFTENTRALNLLGFPTDAWDYLLLKFLLEKLPRSLREKFKSEHRAEEIPKFTQLTKFLSDHCRVLASVSGSQNTSQKSQSISSKNSASASSLATRTAECPVCKEQHLVAKCSRFLKLAPRERHSPAKASNLCYNCLRAGHSVNDCPSSWTCRSCKAKHHTLLHFEQNSGSANAPTDAEPPSESGATSSQGSEPLVSMASVARSNPIVLLSTVQAEALDAHGNPFPVRILLDSASQLNFISESCMQRGGFGRTKCHTVVLAVNDTKAAATRGRTSLVIQAQGRESTRTPVEATILPRISAPLPSSQVERRAWKHLNGLRLADPQYHRPGPIDILIGAEIFASLLRDGRRVGKNGEPDAFNSVFGWVLVGSVSTQAPGSTHSFMTLDSLDASLSRFWQLDEIPSVPPYSQEDKRCEELFAQTPRRGASGRFVVSYPFKRDKPCFVGTRQVALNRFRALERRFKLDAEFKLNYNKFMQDYLNNGYMKLIERPFPVDGPVFYLPHHGVVKSDNTTTKLRVVFDASAKDLNGVLLNDVLRSGPKLQTDIVVILLRFRVGHVALTADVKQMFLRILVERGQCDYQRIVWRFSENDPILDYLMLTVTFGLTCSPFLAIACLLKLATEGKVSYPLAAAVLEESVYVDDVVASAESEGKARELQRQLQVLLKTAGFELRKWASSHPSVLADFDPELCSQSLLSFESSEDQFLKVLGLRWYPQTDNFGFQVHPLDRDCTKRTILSELARIFDPLGFLTPLTFAAKRLIQQLWVLKLEWDDRPPSEICSRWGRYKSELPALASIRIPRTIAMANVIRREIHGFCDASEQGYGAVVYIRIVAEDGVLIRMLSAKSKVAPLKAITLPRLKLCAAVLLSDLAEYIGNILRPKITIDGTYAWSDSEVALAWIRSAPHRWKTFVRNRVARIQSNTDISCWRHVDTKSNPADCCSRGLFPQELVDHQLWWTGPAWLAKFEPTPETILETDDFPEEEKSHVFVVVNPADVVNSASVVNSLLDRFSSLDKLVRIFSYCLRFVNRLKSNSPHRTLVVDQVEFHSTLLYLVKVVQSCRFAEDLDRLKRNQNCSKPLRQLAPFVDARGVLRVGGRLTHSAISHKAKHPALLPDSFLSALRRFIARRGRCSRIYSDCGTNFVGAQRELVSCMEAASGREQIQWSFNPPSAPHFGGLWKAGVKATKTHLKRVVGAQILTVEEFSTLLAQVESILNSRPLCPTSSDPHDLGVLSPGHFITLEPLVAVPYPDLDPVPIGRLDRWQLVQHMHQQFWKRWHEEYLHTLQQRPKLKPADAISKGTLVLLKTENAPPLAWRRRRVEELHPGRDGVARVATVGTADGLLSRPLVKLCPLPMDGSPEGLAQT